MTGAEVVKRLKAAPNRKEVAQATGLRYGYLCKLVAGDIKNPGSAQMDILRRHFERARAQ